MNDTTKIISSDIDGLELRREKQGNYIRCDGKEDNEEIQDALDGKKIWSLGKYWDMIFRR